MSESGYSPPIKIELTLNGESFAVWSLGDGELTLKHPRPVSPGVGLVRLTVDEIDTLYHVNLFAGIDPAGTRQPFRITDIVDATDETSQAELAENR